jgi:predicted house-cleaning noncanonical NTP pyrophosphatase (MazG superfamily)
MARKYRFKLEKLIRDKLPEIMQESGIRVTTRVMGEDEYNMRLKNKLLEEAKEVISATDQAESHAELADLLEVIIAMAHMMEIGFADVMQTAERKRLEKGGFINRIYADFVEIEEGHSSLAYYKERPEKYPQES